MIIIRDDFEFSIKAEAIHRQVSLKVSLTNNSPNNYWLSRDVIYMDGIKMNDFKIEGRSPIVCRKAGPLSVSDVVAIRANDTITTTIKLSDQCHFTWALAGVYTFSKRGMAYLFNRDTGEAICDRCSAATEMIKLTADVDFIIDDVKPAVTGGYACDSGD